ncbi:flagellar basal body L-ring protein FlgH [Yunchengibacter salinarum]|uniref:flagellar basal body L-ring protein FlgH n=1 Tax=Yunchengibacter salinarum TaxID=3133399 RepID=UPI0035B5C594
MIHLREKARTAIGRALLGAAALSLGACGAAERISNIGKAPEMSAIEKVKAPLRERSISLPMPQDSKGRYEPNSLWRTGARAFFRDQRAGQVGDILTVNIDISDSAQIGNSTSRSRQTAEETGLESFFGVESAIPNLFTKGNKGPNSSDSKIRNNFSAGDLIDAESDSNYAGSGSVDRSESIELDVAAIVTDVLPNGNLVIQGRQEVRVNFEKRELLIAGIIRPEDIAADNTIRHSQIAEARISYGGRGQITDVQQPRYGTQLYDIIFPF